MGVPAISPVLPEIETPVGRPEAEYASRSLSSAMARFSIQAANWHALPACNTWQ